MVMTAMAETSGHARAMPLSFAAESRHNRGYQRDHCKEVRPGDLTASLADGPPAHDLWTGRQRCPGWRTSTSTCPAWRLLDR